MNYTNKDGFNVMTAAFLRKKERCCKSSCLHCPYGHTVKKLGFVFKDYDESIDQSEFEDDFFSDQTLVTKSFYLKEHFVGVFRANNIQIKKLYLNKRFRDQDIYKELIEAYYF